MPEHLFSPGKGKPRLVKTEVMLDTGRVAIYAGKAVLEALQIVSMDMDLYKGVRLSQLLTALYTQGLKDGRRHAVETFHAASETLSYRNPGQPKKKKKLKKKK